MWIISDTRRKTDLKWFYENYSNVATLKTVRIVASDDVRKSRGWVFEKGNYFVLCLFYIVCCIVLVIYNVYIQSYIVVESVITVSYVFQIINIYFSVWLNDYVSYNILFDLWDVIQKWFQLFLPSEIQKTLQIGMW